MKSIYKLLTGISVLLTLAACSKMNDLHREYLEKGEKVYAAKVDSVKSLIGVNRQFLDIWVPAQRAVRGKITWNLNEGSQEFSWKSSDKNPIQVIIPNLNDGNYTYDIVLYDAFDNPSIAEEITSSVVSQEHMDEKLRIAKTSFYYSEYDRLVGAASAGGGGDRPVAKIANAQNFNGAAWFSWACDPLPGAIVVFRFQHKDTNEWMTVSVPGEEIKKGAWYNKLPALCTPKDQVKFYYHTEYPGVTVSEDIATRIDLGEEYESSIRFYDYNDHIEVTAAGFISEEIEEIW